MGMRPIKPLMLAVLVISLFFLTQRVAATLIVSCPFGSPGGDELPLASNSLFRGLLT